ncbi:MAG TPA: Hsp20/alpha crystallin family protein [Anaerolineae bacterium]|nr:Hsp20/alpha crystallin family protein [Anaerolineae bacterium]
MLRRDLFDEMQRMQEEMEQLWQFRFAGRYVSRHRGEVWHPPTDVYETDAGVVVRVEVGGLKEGDFEIRLDGHILTISGERRDLGAKLAYHQLEMRYGPFLSAVRLSQPVDETGIEATYRDGILQVVLPKARAHRVPVTVVGEGREL